MRTESQYSWEVQSRWELQSPPLCSRRAAGPSVVLVVAAVVAEG